MSITKLLNVFEILMLIETIIIINSKVISKNPDLRNKTENDFLSLKLNASLHENGSESNKILKFLLNAKEKKSFLLDFNNVLKFESTKNYFNYKLIHINEKYDVEFFIFLFDSFNKFMWNKKPKSNLISRSIKAQSENNKNNLKNKQGKEKSKDLMQKNNDNNNNNKLSSIKRLTPNGNSSNKTNAQNETDKIKDLYNENSTKENYHLKTRSRFKNTINENLSFTDFLYKNSLVNSENSIIVLISKQELMIKIFLGQNQLRFFSYNDQRKIAENFLRNFIEGNTEFGLDELIDNMESLLKTKYPIKLIKLFIIFLIFFSCIANFWYKSRKELKNCKDPQEVISDNLAIIKEITKRNLSKKDFKEYSDNSCMICLEDILDLDCECYSQDFGQKQNKEKIKINEKSNEYKIQSENILIKDYHYYKFPSSSFIRQGINNDDDSYQYSNFNSENIQIDKGFNFQITTANKYSDYLNPKEPKNKENMINANNNTNAVSDYNQNLNRNFINCSVKSNIEHSLDDIGNSIHKENCGSNVLSNITRNFSGFESNKYFKSSELTEVKCYYFSLPNSDLNQYKIKAPTTITHRESINILNDSKINDFVTHKDPDPKSKITSKKNKENFAAVLDCRHKFHSSCLALWMSKGSFCPICRNSIQFISDDDITNKIYANNIEYLDTDASGDSISILIS